MQVFAGEIANPLQSPDAHFACGFMLISVLIGFSLVKSAYL